jgi:membrane protein YqaA with SNARE-associated domain
MQAMSRPLGLAMSRNRDRLHLDRRGRLDHGGDPLTTQQPRSIVTLPWLLAGSFAGGVVSALVPWLYAEAVLLVALPAAAAHHATTALVVVVTLGQMVGKSVMYWLGRATYKGGLRRFAMLSEQWQLRIAQHPRLAVGVVGVSALLGFPPFYVIAMAAGATRIPFAAFLAVGGLARFAHFALLVFFFHL